MRQVIARDDPARTAHQSAADTPTAQLPPLVAELVAEHQSAVDQRNVKYQKTQRAQRDQAIDRALGLHRTTSLGLSAGRGRSQQRDQGYDLSL